MVQIKKRVTMADVVKQLKIKTGVCTRSLKELQSYVREEERERARLATMEGEGAEPTRLRQQVQVVEETAAMIPNCRAALERAFRALESYVNDHATELQDTPELGAAQTSLEAAQAELERA